MEVSIKTIGEKKLVGFSEKMSLKNNKTHELWKKFMTQRNKVSNRTSSEYFSLQVFEEGFDMKNFTPDTEFTKHALVEVSDFDNIPEEMIPYTLKSGKYAVFIYKGLPSAFGETLRHFYTNWLPNSGYSLDQREHFEILPENYSPVDPNAEEEVWIPIK